MPAGELSWEEFLLKSKAFLLKSEALNDSWTLQRVNDDPGGSYLRYKAFKKVKVGAEEQTLLFDYHVLYSISYSVPMLFFNVQDTSGCTMRLDDFLEIFLQRLEVAQSDIDLKTALTQMEHPLLFRPFLAIHPCQTSTVLGKAADSQNKVVTFVSTFGPMVFLDLDLEYGQD